MPPEIDAAETIRALATHASDIRHLQNDVDKMVEDMDEIKKSIQNIQKVLDEATGGRKVLFASISAAGVIGSALTWVAERTILK